MKKRFQELTVQELLNELSKVEDKTIKVNVWSFSDVGGFSEFTSDIELSIDSDGFNVLDA